MTAHQQQPRRRRAFRQKRRRNVPPPTPCYAHPSLEHESRVSRLLLQHVWKEQSRFSGIRLCTTEKSRSQESPRRPCRGRARGSVRALSSHNVEMVRMAERKTHLTECRVPRARWRPGSPAAGARTPAWGPARPPWLVSAAPSKTQQDRPPAPDAKGQDSARFFPAPHTLLLCTVFAGNLVFARGFDHH